MLDVKNLCKRLTVVPGEDRLSIQANENATLLMKILIRATFCAKRVIDEYRLSNEAFDWLIGEIGSKFQAAQVFYSALSLLESNYDLGCRSRKCRETLECIRNSLVLGHVVGILILYHTVHSLTLYHTIPTFDNLEKVAY